MPYKELPIFSLHMQIQNKTKLIKPVYYYNIVLSKYEEILDHLIELFRNDLISEFRSNNFRTVSS